jgi:hypothetical protein
MSVYVAKYNAKSKVMPPLPAECEAQGKQCINVLIHMDANDFCGELSPYNLKTEEGYLLENVWRFSRIYPDVPEQVQQPCWWRHGAENHLDPVLDGPTPEYFSWRRKGFAHRRVVRYPVGFDERFKCFASIWPLNAGPDKFEYLGYIEARKKIYCALYRQYAPQTASFKQLKEMLQSGVSIQLVDVNGPDPALQYAPYDRISPESPGLKMDKDTVRMLLHDKRRPFKHGYTIAALLLEPDGEDWFA